MANPVVDSFPVSWYLALLPWAADFHRDCAKGGPHGVMGPEWGPGDNPWVYSGFTD